MNAAASAAAAAAAAAAERRRQEEEQEMTPYTSEDLAQGWEFKIIRSATGAFKDPVKMRQFLDEESQAGWILVEKFDDARLRLKRPFAARERDGKVAIDPYRINVGTSPNAMALLIVGITLGATVAFIVILVGIVSALK